MTIQRTEAERHASLSLTIGIIGLFVGWCLLCIPNVLAVIFGIMAIRTAPPHSSTRTKAVFGTTLGAVVPILTLIGGISLALMPK